jgi:hypothetical protein
MHSPDIRHSGPLAAKCTLFPADRKELARWSHRDSRLAGMEAACLAIVITWRGAFDLLAMRQPGSAASPQRLSTLQKRPADWGFSG